MPNSPGAGALAAARTLEAELAQICGQLRKPSAAALADSLPRLENCVSRLASLMQMVQAGAAHPELRTVMVRAAALAAQGKRLLEHSAELRFGWMTEIPADEKTYTRTAEFGTKPPALQLDVAG